MDVTYTIAHVSPYPWEAQEHAVNAHVAGVTAELSRRGHRVVVIAPSRSQERVRESRRLLRAARGRPQALLGAAGGEPNVIAVGEVLDLASATRRRPPALPIDVARTVEELLGMLELDFVHVHDPFAPSTSAAALRNSRALNVGSFHTATERVLSTLLARRFLESSFGRLDARTASTAAAAEEMARYFPAEYRLVAPGQPTTAADAYEAIYRPLAARRHDGAAPAIAERLPPRPLIDVDLHMHTDHSYDCATPVAVLLATARQQGLGAIAVTDHNEISGALEARAQSDGAGPKVIVAEEIKTASQGEVIGLFLEELIPRGLSLRETVQEIRRQGGLVYVPHPFDRMHAVPDYEHLLPIVEDVDALEVFNARVAIPAFNDEAARFAAKYRIPGGAGSDSHVPQGLGSVRVRMRDFEGPQEFLESLRHAEIHTRASSLLYVQALKFLQTRATPRSARRASRARRLRRLGRTPGGGRRR